MHEIVKKLLASDERLITILSRYYDASNPIEKSFYEIKQIAERPSHESDFKILEDADSALLKGHQDIDLFVLFIIEYLTLCGIRMDNSRVCAIYQFSLSLDVGKCCPFIQMSYQTTKIYYLNAIGDIAEAEKECSRLLPIAFQFGAKSENLVFSIILNLALNGKLSAVDSQHCDYNIFKTTPHNVFVYSNILLMNNILTCNTDEIQKAWNLHQKYYQPNRKNTNEYFADVIKISQLNFDSNQYKIPHIQKIAQTYNYLLKGDWEATRRMYQDALQTGVCYGEEGKLHKFIPLHLELNMGNISQARLILLEIAKSDPNDSIVDFFRMRLALLEKDYRQAIQHHEQLMTNIRKYKAMGRLIFEMHFSHELKGLDILSMYEKILPEIDQRKIPEESTKYIKETTYENDNSAILGKSHEAHKIRELLLQYADLKEVVYIHGNTGTGKELVARALHQKSKRKTAPFLAINCGALTDSLLESELFGHEIGAFTGAHKARIGIFEAAGKGTVLLDEFGEISARMQVSLLRVLENQEIRRIGSSQTIKIYCRIVVSTNKDLLQAVNHKKFREDLYYRINRFDIYLPPLKNRKEDIPILLHHYLNSDSASSHEMLLSDSLISRLCDYHWPGNIRELKNEMERCQVFNKGKRIIELNDFDFSRLRFAEESITENTKTLTRQTVEKEPQIDEKQRIQEIASRLGKKEQRQHAMHQLFKEYKKLNCNQVMEILRISQSTALKDLKTLEEQGILKRVTPTPNSRLHSFVLKTPPNNIP